MATEKQLVEVFTDKKTGKTGKSEGACPVLSGLQDGIAYFSGSAENLIAYVNEQLEKVARTKLRATARIEAGGAERALESLVKNMVRNAEKSNVELSEAEATVIAKGILKLT